jgi:hypothetical protein
MANTAIQWFVIYGYREPMLPGQTIDDFDSDGAYFLSRSDGQKEVLDALKAGASPYYERYIVWACAEADDGTQELVEVPANWDCFFSERPYMFEKLLREEYKLGSDRKLTGYLVKEKVSSASGDDASSDELIPSLLGSSAHKAALLDRYDLLAVGVLGQISANLLDEGVQVLTKMVGQLVHLHLVFGVEFLE